MRSNSTYAPRNSHGRDARATPASVEIEDRIDAIGQKFRARQIVRGAMLFVAFATAASIIAAFAAHFTGQTFWTKALLAAWWGWIALSAWQWIARPLLIRPDPIAVARLVESRVEGLHNGLTNSLLLARRADIADSPWLPQILQEIAHTTETHPLGQAVKMRDLLPAARWLMLLVVPLLALAGLLPHTFAQGWQQMFHPAAFIPRTGSAENVTVLPGDVTLIAGQPLEITVSARCIGSPIGRLIFERLPADGFPTDAVMPQNAELSPAALAASADNAGANLQYTYRADRVDAPLRYRVEVAGTQSPWYAVTLVRQVKLASLELTITPPPYTRLAPLTLTLLPEEVAKKQVSVAQGSRVEMAANVDVPVSGAMLQAGDAPPEPMRAGAQHERFDGGVTIMDDTPLAVLITDGAKQIIAKLPADALVIRCVKDAPPTIEMKWPTQDLTVAPDHPLKLTALLRDDYGLSGARVLMSTSTPPLQSGSTDDSMVAVHEESFDPGTGVKEARELDFVLPVKPEQRANGNSIRVQVEATDNRLLGASGDLGPQTTHSPIFEIKFADPAALAREAKEQADKLRDLLTALLKQEQALHSKTAPLKLEEPAQFAAAKSQLAEIAAGQAELGTAMQATADTFPFEPDDRVVQKTLLMLAVDPAKEAVDLAASLENEPLAAARLRLEADLQSRQRRIISTLQSLLALLAPAPDPAVAAVEHPHEDLLSRADQFKKLDQALKQYMEEQQKLLDQTAGLAKKPVDQWDDNDRKKLDDLKLAQEKLDAFMQQKVSDFSKNSDQDLSNSSMLKDLDEIYSETTMAKNALNQQATEIAVAAEDNGLELAKELNSNIEKWLANTPDRAQWTQEDPLTKTDTPMPELPKDLQDMIGKLLEQEEDLFDQVEDANANWADSADKAIGMDAADGPIADMSAKGVTGNVLPNDNEMNGRSGEGRQGKSQGEFVGDTAEGKGGRRTPTRLDPTPFAQGQIKDSSTDPSGGATGGGKLSGEGGEGLEGPVPPAIKQQMQRLADKQAELRNTAERLNLQYHLDRYDNFKLAEAVALMRRVESDLQANRYNNALRHRDVTLDDLDTSRLLLGGEVHVQQDTTPATNQKLRSEIDDAMKGELPPAWSEALKAYYEKLSEQ